MWVLIVDRLRAYHTLTARDLELSGALQAIRSGELAPAGEGLCGRLVRGYLEERSGSPALDREILKQCSLGERLALREHLAVIAVLAGVAPLLGLLGTVLGMIEIFDVISIFGTGNAKAMAGGISVAMITTQAGLLVAIPGLFLSRSLMRRAARLETRLDEITANLERSIAASGQASGSPA
jgi:biopolymer transport protein ExbB